MASNRSRSSSRPPSKAGSRSSSRNPAPVQSTAAVARYLQNLGEQLKQAKKKGAIKVSDDILDQVKDILNTRRRNDTPFQPQLIAAIISDLDQNGGDTCSRLDVPLYNTLLRLFLQTTGCPEVERGLYLLAAALYEDAHITAKQNLIEEKKKEIGQNTLQPLLDFFTNVTYPAPLRRWAGIILHQLLQHCEKNIERIETGSDESRRKLGNMILTESNDALKIICGQLIKEFVDAGVLKESLWPADTGTEVYDQFPGSSQIGSWNRRFQTYLDNLEDVNVSQNSDIILYFAHDVDTVPSYSMERLGHHTYVVLDLKTVSLWSPATDIQFDQVLEIPLQCIKRMAANVVESQLPAGLAKIDLYFDDDDDEQVCSLNATHVDLGQVSMLLSTDYAVIFRDDLLRYCPELDDTSSQEGDCRSQDPGSQISVRSSESNVAIAQDDSRGPARFESVVGRPAKGKVEHAKEVRQEVIEEGYAQRDSSENNSDQGTSVGGDGQLSSQLKKKATALKEKANQISLARAPTTQKTKVKQPLVVSQTSSAAKTKAPASATSRHGATARPVIQKQKSKTISQSSQRGESSGETLEQKVEKLSQAFPAESSPTIRGVLVVAGYDLNTAAETLRNGSQSDLSSVEKGPSEMREQSSSRNRTSEEQFDSASFTSPDANDVSTPKFNKPPGSQKTTKAATSNNIANTTVKGSERAKKCSKYSLKSKQPLGRAKAAIPSAKDQENTKTANISSKKTQGRPKAANAASSKSQDEPKIPTLPFAKSQEKSKAATSDLYELSDDEDDVKVSAVSKKDVKGKAKAKSQAPAKKCLVAMKTAPKIAKTGTKKRQSAPAILETTAASTRSRRSAALVSSQKLQDSNLSENEIEDEKEPVDTKKSLSSRSAKITASQNNSKVVPKVKPHEENVIPANFPDTQDASFDSGDDLGPLPDAGKSECDLYNASPEQPVKQPAQHPARQRNRSLGHSNRVSHAGQNFSSKLGNMLGDINDEWIHGYERVGADNTSGRAQSGTLQNHESGQPYENRPQQANKMAQKADIARQESPHPPVEDEVASLAREIELEAGAELLPTHENESLLGDQMVDDLNSSTPNLAANQEKGVPDKFMKRKVNSEVDVPSKRRRSQGDTIQESKEKPSRRSPRLLPDKPLIDDHLTRKTQIVNFGARGANNQGLSSVLQSSLRKDNITTSEQPAAATSNSVLRKSKRARDDQNDSHGDDQMGPPSKRRSISPEGNHKDEQMDHGFPQEYSSSPPPHHSQKPRSSKPRTSKPSSQASRVDSNGSPRALVSAEKIDHFSKVTQKLLQQEESDSVRAANSSLIFHPRIRLTSLPKTGPSSPSGIEVRYVKHQKMGNGVYKGMGTKKVVAPEKSLADPFVGGQERRSSGFTNKLQAGASRENRSPEAVHRAEKGSDVLVNIEKSNVAKKAPNQRTSEASKQERMPIYDEQTTLVNSEPDLTCGSSEHDSRTPLSEKAMKDSWNMVMRPHYGNIAEATHRLADEVILRLANEEDAIELLVHQYKENGGKHLESMIDTRGKEKEQIANNLNQQRREMVAVYGRAKTFVNESENITKSSSLGKFEKQWRKDQEAIHRSIVEGRKALQ